MGVIKILAVSLCVLVLSGTIYVTAQRLQLFNQSQPDLPQLPTIQMSPSVTRPSDCVPFPTDEKSTATLTPTPARSASAVPSSRASVTPRVYANMIDLSPELPVEEKSQIIVFRCNGSFDHYFVGPNIDINSRIQLYPGDVIIQSIAPAMLMGHKPPEPTEVPPSNPPTTFPYPPAITITPTPTIPMTYPAPPTLTAGSNEP